MLIKTQYSAYNLDNLELYRITYICIYEKSTMLHTPHTYIHTHTLFFCLFTDLIKTIIAIRARLSTVCFFYENKISQVLQKKIAILY